MPTSIILIVQGCMKLLRVQYVVVVVVVRVFLLHAALIHTQLGGQIN